MYFLKWSLYIYVSLGCMSYKLCGQLTETIIKIYEANKNISYMYLICNYKNKGDNFTKTC